MLNLILLQAAPAGQNAAGGGWQFWIMMILIFVVFYFFMIRPQQKRQKELENKRNSMKKGDKVVTAGGIYGNIKEVQEKAFLIEISSFTSRISFFGNFTYEKRFFKIERRMGLIVSGQKFSGILSSCFPFILV